MKLKTHTYGCLIFLLVSINTITAQYNETGPDWQACDTAIRQYNSAMNQCIIDFTNLMYSASQLPNPNDNVVSFVRDTEDYFSVYTNPSPGDVYDAWRQMSNFFEVVEAIGRQQGNAMNSIADEFLSSMFGLDC